MKIIITDAVGEVRIGWKDAIVVDELRCEAAPGREASLVLDIPKGSITNLFAPSGGVRFARYVPVTTTTIIGEIRGKEEDITAPDPSWQVKPGHKPDCGCRDCCEINYG